LAVNLLPVNEISNWKEMVIKRHRGGIKALYQNDCFPGPQLAVPCSMQRALERDFPCISPKSI